MPYVSHEAWLEYVTEEYPKALTRVNEDGFTVPVHYPPGHEKQGLAVVFASREEEDAHNTPKVAAPKAAAAKAPPAKK